MGKWYGYEKAVKHYNIGFTEDELQKITAAFNKWEAGGHMPVFRKHTSFIKYLALEYFELKKEVLDLRFTLLYGDCEAKDQEAAAAGQGGASERIIRPPVWVWGSPSMGGD
jgi:hypothetical protein